MDQIILRLMDRIESDWALLLAIMLAIPLYFGFSIFRDKFIKYLASFLNVRKTIMSLLPYQWH